MRASVLRGAVVVWALVLSSCMDVARAYSLVDIPNPMHSPEMCGRKGVLRSVICDPENALSKDSKDVIEGRIIDIEEKQQLQFGIVVINTMNVLESLIDAEAKRYAESIHTTWGVGNKETENGAVVFLAIEDRVVYISTGKGVKDKLTDITVQSIIEHMRPFLRKGQYGEAIEASVVEMDMVMENKSIGPSFLEKYGYLILFGGIFCAFGLYALYEKREEEKLRKGKLALEKLMHEVKASEDNKFQFDSCPICLESFSHRRDPIEMEHLPTDDANSHDTNPSHSVSSYTSSAEYREVRNLIPGQSSGSPSNNSNSSDSKRPMTLHCGHAFCHGCLKEYLSKANRNTVCPICRAPVDPDTPSASPIPPRPDQSQPDRNPPPPQDRRQDRFNPSCQSGSYLNSQHGWGGDTYRRGRSHFLEMELLYRLSRMHARYPTVVTPQSYDTMRTAIETGNTPAFVEAAESRTSEVARTLADIQRRREAAAKGSKGSSRSSFGGGSSRGGGGGGGRW